MITPQTTMQELSAILADYDLRLASLKHDPREPVAERCTVRLVGITDDDLFIGMGPEFVDAINDALADVEALGAGQLPCEMPAVPVPGTE